METLSGRGVSIWLVPEDEEASLLRRLIVDLAQRLGAPPFEPHVTLRPGLPGPKAKIIRTTGHLLAADLEAMAVPLGPAEGRSQPFRCLYLPIALTFRLVHAHALFRSAFAPGDEEPFEPHLSLVYGLLDEEQKGRLAGELAAKVPGRVRLGAIEIVRTEGPVETWQSVARFPLPRPPVSHDRKDP
jgi:2'-5' RNA ligase